MTDTEIKNKAFADVGKASKEELAALILHYRDGYSARRICSILDVYLEDVWQWTGHISKDDQQGRKE